VSWRQVYALRRLARGLGSSHDAARQGFALALAAALARVPEIESLPTLDLLDAALEVSKSMKVPWLAPIRHTKRC
jgi:DNA polymerase phi